MSSFINLVSRIGNDAIQANFSVSDADRVAVATTFLWAVFGAMAVTAVFVLVWAEFAVKDGQRVFHYLAFAILTTASISYYCMASDLGYTQMAIDFSKGHSERPTRAIWYVRYIDWTITTPLLLLELLLVSGLPLSSIFICIFSDLVMIITGLISALVESSAKWPLFVIGCLAMLHVFYILYFPGRKSSYALGDDFGKAYTVGAGILSFLWFLYPLAFFLSEGTGIISPTAEAVFYGTLDFLAKPVFTIFHLVALSKMNIDSLHLSSGKFTVTANHGAADFNHPSTRRDEGNAASGSTAL